MQRNLFPKFVTPPDPDHTLKSLVEFWYYTINRVISVVIFISPLASPMLKNYTYKTSVGLGLRCINWAQCNHVCWDSFSTNEKSLFSHVTYNGPINVERFVHSSDAEISESRKSKSLNMISSSFYFSKYKT